jgi:hypothetical protein
LTKFDIPQNQAYTVDMHEHDHDHEHLYEHGHGHSHGHDHNHEHLEDPAKIEALLAYMLDHNQHHGEEISGLAHSLNHGGNGEAAKLLEEGVKDFEKGNEKLAKALELIRKNPASGGGEK